MVNRCCIKNCKSEWKKSEGVTFHNVPLKEESRKKFIAAIPVNLQLSIQKYSRICSKHFTTDAFQVTTCTGVRRILKRDAVPTLFDHQYHCTPVNEAEMHGPLTSSSVVSDENRSPNVPSLQSTMQHDSRVVKKDVGNQTVVQCSSAGKNDLGTQVQDNYLPPSDSVQQLRHKIKILQRRLLRRDARLNTMADVIQHLKENGITTNCIEEVLENQFSGFPLAMFKNEVQNASVARSRQRYTEEMRSFALTLYFYSPKAYHFMRKELHLPSGPTLRTWLSTYNCQPGFNAEVLAFLKEEVQTNECLKDVALLFDAMSIRSEIVYDKKTDKYRGYIDYGGIAHTDSEELATEVLVLQIVSYQRKLKIAIGFFFINKIRAELQCQILNVATEMLQDIGITVRSITCDGCATNLKTFNLLGCKLYEPKMITSFKHPATNTTIYCVLDACHMLKLCRNAFAEEVIISPKGKISFQFIQKLHEVQESEDLKLANKISVAHVKFQNKQMNVRLAAQVLSSGVADAIDFLRTSGDKRFVDSEATTEFIRTFDQLFDILNSRSSYGQGFKSPIFMHNVEYIKQFFSKATEYVKSLTINGTNILFHKRRTFAIGLLVNMQSILDLAIFLLTKQNPLKYFLSYKCSQDHLELFFSCVRSRGGRNDNPNCLQFIWAFRKLLFRNTVSPSINANCLMDNTQSMPILEFRSSKRTITEPNDIDSEEDKRIHDVMLCIDSVDLTSLQENIFYYISGLIVKKNLVKLSCSYCEKFLLRSDNNDHSYSININKYSTFTSFINRGKLCFPSETVYKIVHYAEKAFRAQIQIGLLNHHHFKHRICSMVYQKFSNTMLQLFEPSHPVLERDGFEEVHELQILKLIVDVYANIRIVTYAKKATERRLGARLHLRQKLHKNILFANV